MFISYKYLFSCFYRFLSYAIPRNRAGDYLFSLMAFIYNKKRFPGKNSGLIGDFIFYSKVSEEAMSPIKHFVSDKEYLKLFVAGKIGDVYNVPTIMVLRSEKEIEDYIFPDRCCIKPTHASGRTIIRKSGELIDKKKIKSWLGLNYYNLGREINYRWLTPKIIVEDLVFDNENI